MPRPKMRTLGDAIAEIPGETAAEQVASAYGLTISEMAAAAQAEPDEPQAVTLSETLKEQTQSGQTPLQVENIIDFAVAPIVGFDPEWEKRHENDLAQYDYKFIRKDAEFGWKHGRGGGAWETVEDHPDTLSDVKLCRRVKEVSRAYEVRDENINRQREASVSEGYSDAIQEASQAYRVPVEKLLLGGLNLPSQRAGERSTKFYSIPR